MNSMIDLNNQAAMLTHNGQYTMATRILRSALVSSTEQETSAVDENGMIRSSSSSSLPSSSLKTGRVLDGEKSRSSKKCHHQHHSHPTQSRKRNTIMDGVDFVYSRPIHIPENGMIQMDFDLARETPNESSTTDGSGCSYDDDDDHHDADRDECNKRRLSECDINTILLFNLALSYHLAALDMMMVDCEDDHADLSSSPSSSTKSINMLKNALRFYELSFSMQVELGVLTLSETLAVVNNCASIYKMLEQRHRAERFYQHMLSTLMTMIESGDPIKDEIKDWDGFLHNICSSGIVLRDEAAAAA